MNGEINTAPLVNVERRPGGTELATIASEDERLVYRLLAMRADREVDSGRRVVDMSVSPDSKGGPLFIGWMVSRRM